MTEQNQENTDSVRLITRPERQLAERMEELYAISQSDNSSPMPQLWRRTNRGTQEDWVQFYISLIHLIADVENTLNSGQLEEFRYDAANPIIQNCKNIVVRLPDLAGGQFRSEYEAGHLTALRLIFPDMSEEESPLPESGWNEILEDLSTLKETIRTSAIPDNFKNDLLNTLIDLEKTINDHQYNGTDPIQTNVDRGLGIITRLLLLEGKDLEDDENIVKRCWEILGRIHTAIYRHPNALPPGIEIMNQIGSGL